MINYDLLALIERVIGSGRKTSGSNYSFFSPFVSHYKPKLEIDLEISSSGTHRWHCWVSNEKGRTIQSLFKRLKVSPTITAELERLIHIRKLYTSSNMKVVDSVLKLPDHFIPISDYPLVKDMLTSIQMRQAIRYLKIRKLSAVDMFRYNIGYCSAGKYSGRIIVPSYDDNLQLNYFMARTIFDDEILKYKNPKISKDVIGFDSMINWSRPITLVEGVFDAMSVRYNTIPLFGKTLSKSLKQKILMRKPPSVTVALDNDAIKDAMYISNFLISNNITTVLAKISDKDISEIGFDAYATYASTLKPMDSFDLIKEKIINA